MCAHPLQSVPLCTALQSAPPTRPCMCRGESCMCSQFAALPRSAAGGDAGGALAAPQGAAQLADEIKRRKCSKAEALAALRAEAEDRGPLMQKARDRAVAGKREAFDSWRQASGMSSPPSRLLFSSRHEAPNMWMLQKQLNSQAVK